MLEKEKKKINEVDDINPKDNDDNFDILFELMQEKYRYIQRSFEILKKTRTTNNKI